MEPPNLTDAKRRLLERIKRGGPCTAGDLARSLEMTSVAVRQHLAALESHGLVAPEPRPPHGRGRPSMLWKLTQVAAGLFPDRHGDLTVGLIEAIRRAYGERGVERVVAERARAQTSDYRRELPTAGASLGSRVRALARRRTAEGYMAEVTRERSGVYLLTEHHCPICEAAASCTGLCSAELEVFRNVLGPGVSVERASHLLSGDDRCVYRIREG